MKVELNKGTVVHGTVYVSRCIDKDVSPEFTTLLTEELGRGFDGWFDIAEFGIPAFGAEEAEAGFVLLGRIAGKPVSLRVHKDRTEHHVFAYTVEVL